MPKPAINTNPSVNRYLKDKSFDRMDHALGRPVDPMRESYRNYFAIGSDTPLAQSFDASPFWKLLGVRDGDMAYYGVNAEGRKALAEHLKSIADPHRAYIVEYRGFASIVTARSHGNARYQCYLNVSDCECDLTFKVFAAAARVRLLPPMAEATHA